MAAIYYHTVVPTEIGTIEANYEHWTSTDGTRQKTNVFLRREFNASKPSEFFDLSYHASEQQVKDAVLVYLTGYATGHKDGRESVQAILQENLGLAITNLSQKVTATPGSSVTGVVQSIRS